MNGDEQREWQRLQFVCERDGHDEARVFARQTMNQYMSALNEALKGGNQYGSAHRTGLEASIQVFEAFLAGHTPPDIEFPESDQN